MCCPAVGAIRVGQNQPRTTVRMAWRLIANERPPKRDQCPVGAVIRADRAPREAGRRRARGGIFPLPICTNVTVQTVMRHLPGAADWSPTDLRISARESRPWLDAVSDADLSRLSDGHAHSVADFGGIDRLAEFETGGQDFSGDQLGVRLRPPLPLFGYRDHHGDPVGDFQSAALP